MAKKPKLIEPIKAEFKDVAKAMIRPKKQKKKWTVVHPNKEEEKEEVKKSS